MPPDDIELDRTKNPYKTLYFSHFPGFTGLRRTMKWWALTLSPSAGCALPIHHEQVRYMQGDQGTERIAGIGGAAHELQRFPLPAHAQPQGSAARADPDAGAALQVLRRRGDLPQAQAGRTARELQARGRLCRAAKLQVPRRKPKKVPAGDRQQLLLKASVIER